MPTPVETLIHDTFTLLADAALGRLARLWRYADPHPYRLRFLRALIADAGLLDLTRRRPTALALDWLAQPPHEQQALLAEAWVFSRETALRQALLRRVEASTPGSPMAVATLTQRESEPRQRSLWQPLMWLGYLRVVEGAPPIVTRTEPVTRAPGSGEWQLAEREILATPPFVWSDLWELEHVAQLVDVGPPRCYRLNAAHWSASRALGFTSGAALVLLERLTGEPLPAALWQWFAPAESQVRLQSGVLLTFTRAADLSRLLARPAWRKRLGLRLSANHVLVGAAQASLLQRALERLKFETHSTVPPPPTPHPRSLSNTDRMHFLLAAQVMQALAQELDLPAPLDTTALNALAQRLPPSQQRRLERAAQRQLEHLRRRLPEPRAIASPCPSAEVAGVVAEAVKAGQALQLTYQPPPPRPPITRAVLPLRLETWGAHTYLLAHCLTRDAPRSFRLDRVLAASPLAAANT